MIILSPCVNENSIVIITLVTTYWELTLHVATHSTKTQQNFLKILHGGKRNTTLTVLLLFLSGPGDKFCILMSQWHKTDPRTTAKISSLLGICKWWAKNWTVFGWSIFLLFPMKVARVHAHNSQQGKFNSWPPALGESPGSTQVWIKVHRNFETENGNRID